MTYSYKVRGNREERMDLFSMTEEEQTEVGRMLFHIMMESSGWFQIEREEEWEK